jgi:hypothetical protein
MLPSLTVCAAAVARSHTCVQAATTVSVAATVIMLSLIASGLSLALRDDSPLVNVSMRWCVDLARRGERCTALQEAWNELDLHHTPLASSRATCTCAYLLWTQARAVTETARFLVN